MLPGTQIHSLRIELCLILEVTKGLSFPCASCITAPSLLSPKGAGPCPSSIHECWSGREKMVWCVLGKGCEGGSIGFCGRKSSCLWVWVLAFSAIAVSLELVVSLILFWRLSVWLMGWIFKNWCLLCLYKESALENLPRREAVGSRVLLGTYLYTHLT